MRAFFGKDYCNREERDNSIARREGSYHRKNAQLSKNKQIKKTPHLDFCKERLYWKRLFREKGTITMVCVWEE